MPAPPERAPLRNQRLRECGKRGRSCLNAKLFLVHLSIMRLKRKALRGDGRVAESQGEPSKKLENIYRSSPSKRAGQQITAGDPTMVAISKTSWIKVWDPLVRFGHWALVIAFAVAYITGEEEGEVSELHEWAGYIVGGIIVWRVVWGLIGPHYARFSDFVKGPKESVRYLVGLIRGHVKRYVGHSPAGGVMVLALLVSLALTVVTGLIADQGYGNASSRQDLSTAVAQALAARCRGCRASSLRRRASSSCPAAAAA
jgi:cytochrome b